MQDSEQRFLTKQSNFNSNFVLHEFIYIQLPYSSYLLSVFKKHGFYENIHMANIRHLSVVSSKDTYRLGGFV